MDIKNIIPLQGLGDIEFGMEPQEVEDILGKPEATETMEEEGETYISWHYDGLGLSVLFEKDDNFTSLEMISVSSAEFTLEGQAVVGLSREALMSKMAELEEMECEEDKENNQHIISYDAIGMDFWMEENKVIEVQWFPMYLDGIDLD